MEIAGYEVIGAANGNQGLVLAQQEPPNAILCDVRLPGIDGYSILMAIRQHADLLLVPFIFLTACADKASYRQGMELGADDYIVKPFTRKEVLQALKTQLEKREQVLVALNQKLTQAEAAVDYLTHYDALTFLPNKYALEKQFQELITELAVPTMMLNWVELSLDHLSRLQNALGDRAKEQVLKEVAQRLQKTVIAPNSLAYLGENQFCIVLLNCPDIESLQNSLTRFQDCCAEPFMLDQRELFVTSSLGVATEAMAGAEFDTLRVQANLAKEEALRRGGNQFQIYQPSLNQHLQQSITIRNDLYQALERGQFVLYYQPFVELKTGRIFGAEALIRWIHPEQGFISPEQFIPIAEESGFIIPLGEWIMHQACQDAWFWNEQHNPPLQVSINLSARQLNHPQLEAVISRTLHATTIDPKLVKLELTESILLQNSEDIQHQLSTLRSLGLQVALDDFGTGYSSFSYIQQLAFDIIKIDRTFVTDIDQNQKNAAIALAVLQMTHNLNCKVIAEGVSTVGELEFLRKHHCDAIQGYYFSPPLPQDAFLHLLETQPRFDLDPVQPTP
ncbi:MAG: EAL domain-containing protein [Spirulina sp. SIO3F2]|nr:EAL domain-containing protein [Spirulina sp. SIO3F2]